MNKTTYKTLAAGAVFLGTIVVSSAQAAMVSYSSSFNTYTYAGNTTQGSGTSASSTNSQGVTLQGFDAGLGDLLDVQISFTSSWYQSSSISALDSSAEYTTYTYSCGFWGWSTCTGYDYFNDTWGQAKSDSNLTVSLVDPSGSGSVSATNTLTSYCSNYNPDFGNASCSDYDVTGWASFNSSLDLSAIALSDFIKPAGDMIDLLFVNDKALQVWCDNNDAGDACSGSSYGSWNGTVTVTYTYGDISVPVSAPATLLLLGLGLAGLGAARRWSADA